MNIYIWFFIFFIFYLGTSIWGYNSKNKKFFIYAKFILKIILTLVFFVITVFKDIKIEFNDYFLIGTLVLSFIGIIDPFFEDLEKLKTKK